MPNSCNILIIFDKNKTFNYMETWKDVVGYEGIYKISSIGNVKSVYRKKQLNPGKDYLGYKIVSLCKNKTSKLRKIHVLMAQSFLGYVKQENTVVDHINNIPFDNRLDNLQIITQRENLSKDKKGKSKYTGVTFKKQTKRWCATIYIDKRNVHLGYYDTEIEAHEAYQNKLKEI
jgi:hypothetical protein